MTNAPVPEKHNNLYYIFASDKENHKMDAAKKKALQNLLNSKLKQ